MHFSYFVGLRIESDRVLIERDCESHARGKFLMRARTHGFESNARALVS